VLSVVLNAPKRLMTARPAFAQAAIPSLSEYRRATTLHGHGESCYVRFI
jgi:hypothetical protein